MFFNGTPILQDPPIPENQCCFPMG